MRNQVRLAAGALIAALACSPAFAQTGDSLTCGSFKAAAKRDGQLTSWTVAGTTGMQARFFSASSVNVDSTRPMNAALNAGWQVRTHWSVIRSPAKIGVDGWVGIPAAERNAGQKPFGVGPLQERLHRLARRANDELLEGRAGKGERQAGLAG